MMPCYKSFCQGANFPDAERASLKVTERETLQNGFLMKYNLNEFFLKHARCRTIDQ